MIAFVVDDDVAVVPVPVVVVVVVVALDETVDETPEYPLMLLTADVIAVCSEVAVVEVTAETAELEPETEYATVSAP